jgi:hypothetical protein
MVMSLAYYGKYAKRWKLVFDSGTDTEHGDVASLLSSVV